MNSIHSVSREIKSNHRSLQGGPRRGIHGSPRRTTQDPAPRAPLRCPLRSVGRFLSPICLLNDHIAQRSPLRRRGCRRGSPPRRRPSSTRSSTSRASSSGRLAEHPGMRYTSVQPCIRGSVSELRESKGPPGDRAGGGVRGALPRRLPRLRPEPPGHGDGAQRHEPAGPRLMVLS